MLTEYFVRDLPGLAQKIHAHGIAIMDQFLPETVIKSLRQEIHALTAKASMKAAGTGRQQTAVNPALRGDHIYWLDEQNASSAQQLYFDRMDAIRQVLNAQLFLGLHSLECHLALYTPGKRYQKHLDRFQGETQGKPLRQLSSILYLNKDWQPHNGGQLRIYQPETEIKAEAAVQANTLDVLPVGGRAVFFLSDTFYHEVLPADRDRMSLTGWHLTR